MYCAALRIHLPDKMRMISNARYLMRPGFLLLVAATTWSQVLYTDSFDTNIDYLCNGIVGTIWAQLNAGVGGLTVMFSANPGKRYWLQYSDALNPANWQNVVPGPVQSTGTVLSIVDGIGGSSPQ